MCSSVGADFSVCVSTSAHHSALDISTLLLPSGQRMVYSHFSRRQHK